MSTETEATPDRRSRTDPESLRLRALSAGFTVDDLEESLTWYRDIVGFTVEETFEHEGKLAGAAIVAGSARLFIGQDDGAKGWDRVKGVGSRLFLHTVQDVDALAAGIKSRGGTLDSEPADTPWGTRAFSLTDPNGFQLTVTSTDA